MPPHRATVTPYAGLYVVPFKEDAPYREADGARIRWVELEASGFAALNGPGVMSHDLDATVFLPRVPLHLGWERFYEPRLDGTIDSLDILAGHLAFNVTGPFVSWLEPYLLVGLSGLHGESWTPAFDLGLDVRVYPIAPVALRTTTILSVYAHGPPLVDARLQAGVSLGRVDVLAGPRVLYQGSAQGFWGPSAAVAVRF